MILDNSCVFSDRQSLVGAVAGSVNYSTNAVYLGDVIRDVGQGTPVYIYFHIDTAVVGGLDTLLTCGIAFDTQSSMPSALVDTRVRGTDVNSAGLGAGFDVVLPITQQTRAYKDIADFGFIYNYARVFYVVGGATDLTAGVVSAWPTLDPVSFRKLTADARN